MSRVPVKVILGGPPHSGKSVLREALKDAILRLKVKGAPYPYVLTACPDGEGSLFQKTAGRHPELAARLKARNKSQFTWQFTRRVAESLKLCPLPLTMVDLGGIVDKKNEAIAKFATHAILIAGDPKNLEEWRAFCRRLNLKMVAELHSAYHGKRDRCLGIDSMGVLRGSVHHLERGEDASGRRVVQVLARHLIDLTAGN